MSADLQAAPAAPDTVDGPELQLSTAPAETPQRQPGGRRLAPLIRTWRQLTSMRTALLLLFLLAVAAVPGSLLPQRPVSPLRVQQYLQDHPKLGPFLDRLSGFNVFSSPWFGAVYALLFISLIGCLVPRMRLHARALVRRPPATPAHPSRLSTGTSFSTTAPAAEALAAARSQLRRSRFRVAAEPSALAAEKGYLRETGNLVFHVSLVVLLVGIALGSLRGYSGTVLVVQGDSMSNNLVQYDQFSHGALVDPARLRPFSFRLDAFTATYQPDNTPREFRADLAFRPDPSSPARRVPVRVNHPLRVGEAKVYLVGHGYAIHVVLRDRTGSVVLDDAVPCTPTNQVTLYSQCTIKVPDTGLPAAGSPKTPQQLAFAGPLTPTPPADGSPLSTSPLLQNPVLRLQAYVGNLHLDEGTPQNVYSLDTRDLKVANAGGPTGANRSSQLLQLADPSRRTLSGLPGGMTLTADSVVPFATFAVKDDPGKGLVLGAAVLLLLGLVGSLVVRRRRVWVRVAADEGGRTVVEMGGIARSGDLSAEFDDLVAGLRSRLPEG